MIWGENVPLFFGKHPKTEASGVSLGPFLLASSLFGAPWSAMSAVVGSTLASLPEAEKARGRFGWLGMGYKWCATTKWRFFSWYMWILWYESEFHLVVLAFFFVIKAEPYFKVAGLFWRVDVPWIFFRTFSWGGSKDGNDITNFPLNTFLKGNRTCVFP